MRFYSRHADEYRREHGEHIGLNEGYKHFHTIHKDAEKYGYNAHGGADSDSHTGRYKNDTCQSQDNGVAGKNIRKQTNH